jgi:L-ascorbate metabolism protein UlaG (beta-lactamase superfamily)
MLIRPVLQDDALLADIKAGGSGGGFRIWWLGQSGFLLQWRGRHALLDPYLSDSLTRKYAGTATPHVRMTARPIDPARLDFVDVVSASHAHTDHLDPETLRPILQANAQAPLVLPEAIRELAAERLGVPASSLIGLDDGASVEAGGFRFTGVASAHETLDMDAAGHSCCLGYVVQFGSWSVYHSGDTLLYEGLADKLRPFAVNVALLPINGRAPERRVAGNLNGREASWLGRQMGAPIVIPCHYEMFEFNTADPLEFAAAARADGQPFAILRCGERWEVPRARRTS